MQAATSTISNPIATLRELIATRAGGVKTSNRRTFTLGVPAVDALLPPDSAFAGGAVHEVFSATRRSPRASFFAMLLAKAAMNASKDAGGGLLVWSDPRRTLFPQALASAGVDVSRLVLLRPKSRADELWAVAECLRCNGVAAVVAHVPKLTGIEARRLQLAAEQGSAAGILLRPFDDLSAPYAAATRWLVRPAKGDERTQRWMIQLIHGHGGRVNDDEPVLLEADRDTKRTTATRLLRPPEEFSDRSREAKRKAI